MPLFRELKTAFPFYKALRHLNRYRENADNICDFKLISPRDAMLPFEFFKNTDQTVTSWKIFEVNTGNLVAEVTDYARVREATREGRFYRYYDGSQLQTTAGTLNLSPGWYYAELDFDTGGNPYYSEMFHVPGDSFVLGQVPINYMEIEWYNMTDINPIFYNDLLPGPGPYFKNRIYVDTFITASEPEFEEDGERDGNDDLVPTFQKAIYRYRITFPVADYLKRALVLLPMHDVINIKTKGGDSEGSPRNIRVDTTLEANGGLSLVDLVFSEEVSITRKGCSANMV